MAYDYSQNNICVEILNDGSDLITIQHDATINCNKSDLAKFEERICNYKYNSTCYYAKHYKDLLEKFHENNDTMVSYKWKRIGYAPNNFMFYTIRSISCYSYVLMISLKC